MQAALFVTCLSDALFPRAAEAVARLLHREGVHVTFPEAQTCCGQPAFNSGYHGEARQMAEHWLQVFAEAEYIVSPSGSCVAMVRAFYPQLFPEGTARHRDVLRLAARTYEFSEFMTAVLRRDDIGATFPGRATYHFSCHMTRELGIADAPITLLQHVRGLEYVPLARPDLCCGFGGTFSVRMPELSVSMADEKLAHVAATEADVLVASDAGCLLQLAGRLQYLGRPVRCLHLAELLAEGVGLLPRTEGVTP